MKLSPIRTNLQNISFKQRIIDAHTHIGYWDKPNGAPFNTGDIFEAAKTIPAGDSIEKVIVSNLDCLKLNGDGKPISDEIEGNLVLLKQIDKNPKIAPLIACQPKCGNVDNIKKIFKDNPDTFVGLKFHPDEYKIPASSDLLDNYLKFAQSESLPCVFHCGISDSSSAIQYSHPEEIYKAAKKIPDTPVIMAHLGAGGESAHKVAINTLLDSIENNNAKLYADISWVDIDTVEKPNIIKAIKALKNTSKGDKTQRLLFGSDAPLSRFSKESQSYGKFISQIKEAIKNDSELAPEADELIDKIFYKNAQELFFTGSKNTAKTLNENISQGADAIKSTKPKNKYTNLIALGALVGTIILTYAYRIYKNRTSSEIKK